jgi:hypothetical protein
MFKDPVSGSLWILVLAEVGYIGDFDWVTEICEASDRYLESWPTHYELS